MHFNLFDITIHWRKDLYLAAFDTPREVRSRARCISLETTQSYFEQLTHYYHPPPER
jgi:hypothetical protein